MARPQGTIGETKFKILAIIKKNEEIGKESYGYNIWLIMKGRLHCYLEEKSLRNVYHHLNDLCEAGYIRKDVSKVGLGNQYHHLYSLTNFGREFEDKVRSYLQILEK